MIWALEAGKTKTAIDISRSIYSRNRRMLKTLIICPIAVLENWRREYAVHSHVPPAVIRVIDGKTKLNGRKVKTAQLKLKLEQLNSEGADIFIINTESVGNGNLWPIIMGLGFELLIVDESHRFKSHNAKRTKALHALTNQQQLAYRYILTGSPVLQDALDLWAQFYILNPEILGRNFFAFRAEYFYDANASMPSHIHFPNWIPKDEAYYKKLGVPYEDDTAKLNKVIYQHASRVMKDDVLDLPPYIEQKVEVEMPAKQARLYKEMRDHLVATLDKPEVDKLTIDLDGEVMAADLAITKTLRLMQLTAGIFTSLEGVVTVVPTAIEKELKDMLEEVAANKENKIIIWSIFIPTYEVISKICTDLDIKFTFLTGLQDKDEKQANIDAFNTDESVQVIIANQAAGGTGVNLTAANYDFYYSWDYSLEKYLQSAARGYRGGQTRKYTSYKLVTVDTIAEKSLQALEAKAANAEDILAPRKELTREEIIKML